MAEIKGFARQKIHPGKLEEFKRLQALCMESVRTRDSGTLQYEVLFNADQSECVVYERYRDPEALLEHVRNLGPLMGEIMQVCTTTGEVLGTPDGALRKMLEEAGVGIYTPYQSYSR